MCKHLLFLLFFLFVFTSAAQECSKNSVYFRSDKHNLKKNERATIDSLLQKLDPEKHYLVDLYAYTDSSNTITYNYQLSGKRNRSVRDYIQSVRPKNVVFIMRNLGEKTAGDLQQNRRVDIYTYPLDDKDRILVEGSMGVKAWVSYRNFTSCGYCLGEKPTFDSYYMTNKSDEKVLSLAIKRDCPVNEDYKCDTAEFRIPSAVFNGSPSKFNRRSVYAYRYSKWHGMTENMKSDSLFRVTYDTLTNEYIIHYGCYNMQRIILCGGLRTPCDYYQIVFPSDVDPIKTSVAYPDQPKTYQFPKAFSKVDVPGSQPELPYVPIPEHGKKFWYLKYSGVYALERNCPEFVSVFSHGVRDGELVFAKFTMDQIIADGKQLIFYHTPNGGKEEAFQRLTVPDGYYEPLKYTNVKIKLKMPKHVIPDSAGIFLEPYDFFIPIKKGKKNRYESMMPEMEFDMAVYTGSKQTVIPFAKIKKRYKKRKYVLKMKIRNRNL